SDPQATSGLERVVLGTERLDVAESCQSALEGIEVEERDDVIHFRLLRCPRATRCRAAVPLLDQRLAQVLRDRVARGLRIEWGAGGRIGEDPLDGLRPTGDRASYLGGNRRAVGQGAGQVRITGERKEGDGGDGGRLLRQPPLAGGQ